MGKSVALKRLTRGFLDFRYAAYTGYLLLLLPLGLVAFSSAQASLACKFYSWRNQELRYHTTYRYTEAETHAAQSRYPPLPVKGVYAIARLYAIEPDAPEARPCSNLSIEKRLFLQRRDDPEFVLREISEFYAEDGTLITTNSQVVTEQMPRTGYYMAHDLLPIPEDAPPGRYHLVTKLILTKEGRKATFLLGSSKTEYRILPLD